MAEKNQSNGIGLGTLLFLIFLILKLTDNIDWSWWWVTAPLWIPLAIVSAIAVIAAAVAVFEHNNKK
jgi:hypothetical protein